jgi:arginase
MADVRLIAAPYHAGAYNHRVGAGPLRLIDDGIEAALQAAGLRTSLRAIGPVDEFEGEIGKTFELKRRISAEVRQARTDGLFPVILAGNCNSEVGVWAGIGAASAGLIWFDAHADFDTPDEHGSGYFDGMGVATLAGQCWHNLANRIDGFQPFDVARLLYCGIRDFEPGQREKVGTAGISAVFGSKNKAVDYAPGFAAAIGRVPFADALIHLDLDCLDTRVGIANEYAAPGGLSAHELHSCLQMACAVVRPLSLTIASFNPVFAGAERISKAAIEGAVIVASAARTTGR